MTTMHLHQTNNNNEIRAHPKRRMVYEKKNTEQTKEEEINMGKVGILKFVLGVEEFLLGSGKKSLAAFGAIKLPFSNPFLDDMLMWA